LVRIIPGKSLKHDVPAVCFQEDAQSETTYSFQQKHTQQFHQCNFPPPIFPVALDRRRETTRFFVQMTTSGTGTSTLGEQESLPSLVQSECNSPERHANGSSGLPSSVGVWGVVPILEEIE